MTDDSYTGLILALKGMIGCCEEMYALLEQDVVLFKSEKFTDIDLSNKKKGDVLLKLSIFINEINQLYPSGLSKTLNDQLKDLPEGHEVKQLFHTLQQCIMDCNQYINSNSSVVLTNLNMLREIWEKLVAIKSQNNVYDKSGNIVEDTL